MKQKAISPLSHPGSIARGRPRGSELPFSFLLTGAGGIPPCPEALGGCLTSWKLVQEHKGLGFDTPAPFAKLQNRITPFARTYHHLPILTDLPGYR